MKRGHTAGTFRDIVQKIKERFSEFTISTDIIVGFPSETEEDFQKTVSLLDEIKPDVVNLSRYSARPGTDAAELKQIDDAESKRRSKIVFEQISKLSMRATKNGSVGRAKSCLMRRQMRESKAGTLHTNP